MRAFLLVMWLAFQSLTVAAQTSAAPPPVMTSADAAGQDAINADRPGFAEGSGVIGRGRVQIESGVQYERRNNGDGREGTLPLPTLLRIGLSSHVEARIEGNTFTQVRTSGSTERGLSPISLGAKIHVQESDGVRQPSLGAIVRVFPRSGTGTFHADRTTGDVRFAADWDLTPHFVAQSQRRHRDVRRR